MDHINNDFPICSVITPDINAKCLKWCNKDIPNSVGNEIYISHHDLDINKLSKNLPIL